jgi:transglutaminase-like putative cysteine protease
MNRRDFLAAAGGLTGAALVPARAGAQTPTALEAPPHTTAWRRYEVVTEIELRPDAGATRLWLPLPMSQDRDYFQAEGIEWSGNPARAGVFRDPVYGAPSFYAEWGDSGAISELKVTASFRARNRFVDLSSPSRATAVDRDELALYLAPTPHIPTDGIVRATASRILPTATGTPVERAHAIYEWIVENTYRDPKVQGCGTGDIRFMLESGNLGGKCADLNALFVGLARASGVPARDVYGVRVANSSTWKSLGKAGDISKAQHCRAEFYDARFGGVPVDPADVRKVILEEAGTTILPLDDPRVALARRTLFGFWEMNWLPFNTANDTALAPRTRRLLNHFMYPHAETAKGVLDPYDPDSFRYRMTSREIPA